jgi:hypothetical protein
MGLEIFKRTAIVGIKGKSSLNNTYLGINNGFNISLCANSFYQNNKNKWRTSITEFNGIMLDNISMDLSTPWGDAGGATLGKKIAGYANSKFIKMFAGQSSAGFQPFICSDAWTQQKVNGDASPIKISLKFKAYNNDRLGCTNYNDIIKFLIHICSPMKSATGSKKISGEEGVGSQAGKNIRNAVNGAVSTLDTIIDAGKQAMNLQSSKADDRNTAGKVISHAVNTMNSLYNSIIAKSGNGNNNANFTVVLVIGNVEGVGDYANARKINRTSISVNGVKNKTTIYPIDWIITSFNFKPSTEFSWDDEHKMPKPLWVDFELSMETRLSLSNKYITELFKT